MTTVKLKGIHKTYKTLASGKKVQYHYAGRDGARFWKTGDSLIGSEEYMRAYYLAIEKKRPRDKKTFNEILNAYQKDFAFKNLADRTQADYLKWIVRTKKEFGTAPVDAFNHPKIRQIALKWRGEWQGKQALYGWTVLRRIVGWAHNAGHLQYHHLQGGGNPYQPKSRADVIWTEPDIAAFMDAAPPYIQRVLTSAIETGLRPGDLINLTRFNATGDVIQIKTRKRGRTAIIPITPAMRSVLENTPPEQPYVLVNSHGQQFSEAALSRAVKRYAKQAGLDDNLRLYDCRGTFVTNCVMAKLPIDDIAKATAWSIRTASDMIDTYAQLYPDPKRIEAALLLLKEARK